MRGSERTGVTLGLEGKGVRALQNSAKVVAHHAKTLEDEARLDVGTTIGLWVFALLFLRLVALERVTLASIFVSAQGLLPFL